MDILLERILNNTKNFSEDIAIEYQDKQISYKELSNMVVHIAAFLEKEQLEEKNVLILQDKDYRVVADILGLLYSGNVFVPAHCGWPLRQLQTVAENVEASYVFTEKKYLPILSELAKSLNRNLHAIIWGEDCSNLSNDTYDGIIIDIIGMKSPLDAQLVQKKSKDVVYIYHTSGSTSEAKEVLGSKSGVWSFIEWQKKEFDIEKGIRVSMLTNLTFDPVLRDIFLPLYSGGTLCIPEPNVLRCISTGTMDRRK